MSDPTPTPEDLDPSRLTGDEISSVVCPDDENYVFVAGGPGRALRCTGHLSDGSGRRCTQPAFANEYGPGKCIRHGVNQAVRAATKRRIEGARLGSEVAALAAELGAEMGPDMSPIDVLVASVRQAWVRAAIFDLYVSEQVRPWGSDHLGDHRPTAAEEGLRFWTTEAARRAKRAVDAGVDRKRLDLEEHYADELVGFGERLITAVEVALLGAGFDVREALAGARPTVFRDALQLGGVVEADAVERLPEEAKSAADREQNAN